jgi:hypothetical protein
VASELVVVLHPDGDRRIHVASAVTDHGIVPLADCCG